MQTPANPDATETCCAQDRSEERHRMLENSPIAMMAKTHITGAVLILLERRQADRPESAAEQHQQQPGAQA